MKKLKFGPGLAVFVLFFAIAVIDAFESLDWKRVGFWIGIGAVFFLLDNLKIKYKSE